MKKSLAFLVLLLSYSTAFACPAVSGNWTCKKSGVTYFHEEKIKVELANEQTLTVTKYNILPTNPPWSFEKATTYKLGHVTRTYIHTTSIAENKITESHNQLGREVHSYCDGHQIVIDEEDRDEKIRFSESYILFDPNLMVYLTESRVLGTSVSVCTRK